MRFKTLFFIFAGWLITSGILAQAPDVVKLKSGAIYKGTIATYIPGDSLVMKLATGEVLVLGSDSVRNIQDGTGETLFNKSHGFFHMSGMGMLFGYNSTETDYELGYNMVNGFRMGKSLPGIGVGMEGLNKQPYVPVFISFDRLLTEGNVSAFAGIEGGKVFELGKPKPNNYYDYYYYGSYANIDYRQGIMGGAHAGVMARINKNFGLFMKVGFRYYYLKGEEQTPLNYPFVAPYPQSNRSLTAELFRLNVQIGMLLF